MRVGQYWQRPLCYYTVYKKCCNTLFQLKKTLCSILKFVKTGFVVSVMKTLMIMLIRNFRTGSLLSLTNEDEILLWRFWLNVHANCNKMPTNDLSHGNKNYKKELGIDFQLTTCNYISSLIETLDHLMNRFPCENGNIFFTKLFWTKYKINTSGYPFFDKRVYI